MSSEFVLSEYGEFMSTRYNNGSHYENHQLAAELHDKAAHAHRSAAEQRGKQDHLTSHELSRQALEYSRQAYLHSQEVHHNEMGLDSRPAVEHEEIA